MTQHIISSIKYARGDISNDKSWWMGNSNRTFTVKSTSELVKKSIEGRRGFELIWAKGCHLKLNSSYGQ